MLLLPIYSFTFTSASIQNSGVVWSYRIVSLQWNVNNLRVIGCRQKRAVSRDFLATSHHCSY